MEQNSVYARRFTGEGLTFDDVLLVPAESDVLPADVDLVHQAHEQGQAQRAGHERRDGYGHGIQTWRSPLPREGGIGVIHKNMSIERQAEQVDHGQALAKTASSRTRSSSTPDHTLGDADALMGKYPHFRRTHR